MTARIILCFFMLHSACACKQDEARNNANTYPDQEELIEIAKRANRTEAQDIRNYITRKGLKTFNSGTGVEMQLIRDMPGATVRPGDRVLVHYRVELLNGDTCYTSPPDQVVGFKVEQDDVESGLHEGIQKMSPGDSAVIIIPSYRAHGLVGDRSRIPPRSTVVYRIGCVGVEQ